MAARSDSIGALAAALAKAQGEMEAASKANVNPHFKSKYADLASVWDAIRGPLAKNGLSVLQPVTAEGSQVTITTILAHSSGEFISESLTMTAQQNTPQAVGSAITYGRRYGLSAMVGVAPDDDDGNAASERGSAPARTETPRPTPEPAGFAAWFKGLDVEASKGLPALQSAWKAGKQEHRDFATSRKAAEWAALKLKATGAAEAVAS